ncbi:MULTISPECIES: LuxR family transcriptional regulator [unclassified Variovorax]|uniref:helix-turn-helix transcriptional regulator n=1 Tax=unclassified Variovorax TaxID=663243 RepID=UPI0008AFAEB0|nr:MULTISPECIES: LuxR family transcriptional regulator [unclassified Variovorax]SEK12781.1 regulatory protein, luxR family [Variovorax sp. OK202]SFD83385.1 regulatory protein, luxR family [Variovorax sp. OK212]
MDLIPLKQPPAHRTHAAPGGGAPERASLALAGVIGCTGQPDFSAKALAELNKMLPMCWMSIYRLYPHAPPESYGGGAFGIADGTRDSWRVYRRGLYSRDRTFLAAREVTEGGDAVVTRWHAREIPLEHRKAIYIRHGLRERVSLVEGDPSGGVLAVNLYRGMAQSSFRDDEVDLLCSLAPPLLATVQLHLRLTAPQHVGELPADDVVALSPEPSALSELPRREREVCQRLLRGWTYDGIAADLGISAGTVKTYRNRAFERMGLHHRNELFAKALAEVAAAPGVAGAPAAPAALAVPAVA